MGSASLTVLLTQAVGNDNDALQAWTQTALRKKQEGDGATFALGMPVYSQCAPARTLYGGPAVRLLTMDGIHHTTII